MSPEPKPRQRVGTNPDVQRPVVPLRPSLMKRSVKAKSAADLMSVPAEGKPAPQPKPKPKEENDKERRRLSNEAGKPVPPKPAPKEKPHVPGRPTVPTRPSSISRGRGNSQKEEAEKRKSLDAEKRKSVEPETAPDAKK